MNISFYIDSDFPFPKSIVASSDYGDISNNLNLTETNGTPQTTPMIPINNIGGFITLAIVQPNSEERQRTVISLLRSKTLVALIGITDDSQEFISHATQTARRNHLPLIILGSWRFIPAVAALKEIVSTNCIGNLISVSATPAYGFATNLFRNDLSNWLAPALPLADDQIVPTFGTRFIVTGSAGSITADFSLDGSLATLNVNILGKSKTRHLPTSTPLESELAILTLYLNASPKLKKLPLLMTL